MAQLAPVTVALAVGREWLPLAERMLAPKPGWARRAPELASKLQRALEPELALASQQGARSVPERASAQELASERALA